MLVLCVYDVKCNNDCSFKVLLVKCKSKPPMAHSTVLVFVVCSKSIYIAIFGKAWVYHIENS